MKHFANNLKADTLSESYRDLKGFVNSYSVIITRELFAMASIDEQQNIKPHVLEAEHGLVSVEKRLAEERKVDLFL